MQKKWSYDYGCSVIEALSNDQNISDNTQIMKISTSTKDVKFVSEKEFVMIRFFFTLPY